MVMMCSRPKHRAADEHERDDHREAGEDGAGDEVGREDRRVPAGHERDREVEGHDECTESTSGVERAARIRYAVS